MIDSSTGSWESPQESVETRSKEKHEAYMEIQKSVIESYLARVGLPFEATNDDFNAYMNKWIDENHKDFKTVFDDVFSEKPKFLEEYEKNPDAIISAINERMAQLVSR